MLSGVECPRPVYDKIWKSGLIDKIRKKEKTISNLLLHAYPNEVIENRIKSGFEKYVLKNKDKISNKTELYKELSENCDDLYNEDIIPARSEEFLFKFPSILTYAILDEDVLNFTKYSFNTRRELEECITSFCISIGEEIDSLFKNSYIWRTKNYKNSLSNFNHGDLSVNQIDILGKHNLENTLFGKQEVFDTWKSDEGCRKGIGAHFDAWEEFLIIVLRYAETIGKEKIPDIINWKSVTKEVGAAGTCSAEAEFGGGGWSLKNIKMEFPLLVAGKEKLEMNPLQIWHGSGEEGTTYYPYVSNGKLLFITKSSEGEIELPFKYPVFEGKKFTKVLEFDKSDLPYLLRGTYRLFARDRSILPKIMDAFISEKKEETK